VDRVDPGEIAHRRGSFSGEAVPVVVDGVDSVVGDGGEIADEERTKTADSRVWSAMAIASRGEAGEWLEAAMMSGALAILLLRCFCGEESQSSGLESAPEGGKSIRARGRMLRPLPCRNPMTNVGGVLGLWLCN
jgi:hypothetical protein